MVAAPSLPAFGIRPGVAADLNYIRDTWRKSEHASIAHTEGQLYPAMQTGAMTAILSRPSTVVRIAFPAGDEETIAAWAVLRPPMPVLHKGAGRIPEIGPIPVVYYVYVREDGRRLGLASRLLSDVLNRPRAIMTSRPAHVRTAQGWNQSPVHVPRHWLYVARAAFVEP